MNKIDVDYQNLVRDILENGTKKSDRTLTGTISVFGRNIRHSMKDGFPLLTTKKMAWKTMVTELLWFLRGDTNIKYLVNNGCHIWDGDAYKKYKTKTEIMMGHGFHGTLLSQEEFIDKIKTDDEFAKTWGELGPIYGKQWRSWSKNDCSYPKCICEDGEITYCQNKHESIDQIANVINLLKTDPDSRRMIVNSWNVADLPAMVLPPCHMMFQFYTRELSWYDDLDKIKKTYVDWSLSKPSGGYAGDIKADTIESANQIFVNGWQKYKDPFTGKPLIELECFSSIPKRAISLMWTQRSVDVGLGLPFNIASYALLLEIVAKSVNMVPEEVIGDLGDCHIYNNHIDGLKEQLTRTPYELPSLNINTEFWPTESGECGVGPLDATAVFNSFTNDHFCKCLLEDDIQLYNYQSHPSIKLPLSN